MKPNHKPRPAIRPMPGDKQAYPGASEAIWKDWRAANDVQQSQARHISKNAAAPGALLLVEIKTGRVLRVLDPNEPAA